MKIEILGMGCPKCKMLYENAKKAVEEKNIEAEVVKVEDMVSSLHIRTRFSISCLFDKRPLFFHP